MKDVILKLGEREALDDYDFDLEDAVAFADFFNNGGLEFHTPNGWNDALVYAAVSKEGEVRIGTWSWRDGEDFDTSASFSVCEERDFSKKEREQIIERINEIYRPVNA